MMGPPPAAGSVRSQPQAHPGGRPPLHQSAAVRAVIVAAPIALALPVLARRYLSVTDYWLQLGITTVILIATYALLSRLDAVGRACVRFVTSFRISLLAAAFLVLAVAVTFLVFDNVPHVSDEVAYQFQARALAAGRLAVDSPSLPEFFTFVHTVVDGDRWYGIMNPGWPAMLAIGVAAGTSWLINPLLGAATLLVFLAFLRRAGYTPLEARIAVLLMATSPFVLFMSGTFMAHTANLFLFAVFLWACAASLDSGRVRYALVAGLALGINLLVRPIDTAAASLPFILYVLFRALRHRKLLGHVAVAGILAGLGVAATMLYNRALTGDFRLMPMEKYFLDRNPAERFGMGFGADMGTTLHGAEWPGYYPLDAVRVTAYRLSELLGDLNALPILLLAALLYPVFRRSQLRDPWHALLLASALSLVGVYLLHFYHGIAYGSRHYFLAVPALAVSIARPLAAWIGSADALTARRARTLLAALLLFTLTVPYVILLPEYSNRYRQASGLVRDAVEAEGLADALVFVHEDHWAWKSAFPLNEYPLESNAVIYAKDRGTGNTALLNAHPGRTAYRLHVTSPTTVEITPLEAVER